VLERVVLVGPITTDFYTFYQVLRRNYGPDVDERVVMIDVFR
jgi:hypothetical protein